MSLSASSDNTPTVLKLPPEIFPLVASHLPLQHLPTTLSALALTSSDIYSYVQPVLYRKVIIKKANQAFGLFDRISKFGPFVWELHIRLNVAAESSNQGNRTRVFAKLQEVIQKGLLPQLKYLRLVIVKSAYPRWIEKVLITQYRLPRQFWGTLRRGCPLLSGVSLDGVGDLPTDPWVNETEFYGLKDFLGLTTFSFKCDNWFPTQLCSDKLCQTLINLASTLGSLTLFLDGAAQDAGLLFSTTFPKLKSFRISCFGPGNTENAMDFWKRHPSLEQVSFYALISDSDRWFSDNVESGLLPNLKHLRAHYNDVKALETHLGQLEHLSITKSYNFQIPYLLRSVLPNGLPRLRSLEIHQTPCSDRSALRQEGARWHETVDGQFIQNGKIRDIRKSVDVIYMQSIVRGAPHLEELCIHDIPPRLDLLKQISPIFGQLRYLHRFYFYAFGGQETKIGPEDMEEFLQKCRILGESCNSLSTVTDVGIYEQGPYLVGNIIRGLGDSVERVVPGRGFGMEFTGGGDDPFPLNPRP